MVDFSRLIDKETLLLWEVQKPIHQARICSNGLSVERLARFRPQHKKIAQYLGQVNQVSKRREDKFFS
jgi:hypothetical protein